MTRKSDAVIMQLVAMAVFAAWNISWSAPGTTPGCGPDPASRALHLALCHANLQVLLRQSVASMLAC